MKKYILQTALFLSAICNLVAQNKMGSNIYSLTQYFPNTSAVLVSCGMKMTDNQYYYLMQCDVESAPNYFIKSGLFTVNDSVIDFVSRFDSTNYFVQVPGSNMMSLNDSILLSPAGIMLVPQAQPQTVPYYFFTFNTNTREVIKKTYFIQQGWGNGSDEICHFNNEVLLFCGPAFMDTNNVIQNHTAIYRYNNNLEELERIHYPRSFGDLQSSTYSTFLKDENKIVVSGWLYDRNRPSDVESRSRLWLHKINENLEIEQQYVDATDSSYGAAALLKTSDGGYLAFLNKLNRAFYDTVAGIADYSYSTEKASIYKFDENLNLQWQKNYIDNPSSHFSNFNDVIQTQDGNFVSAGTYKGYYSQECNCEDILVWLQKVDEEGNVIWNHRYRVINEERWNIIDVKQIMEEEDGNLRIIIVMDLPFLDLPVLGKFANIFRTDANGCIDETCSTVGVEELNNEINTPALILYPNPSSETLNIHFSKAEFKIYTLRLANLQGKIILETQIDDSYDSLVNVFPYASGMYNCSLIENGKIVQSKIFIKQ